MCPRLTFYCACVSDCNHRFVQKPVAEIRDGLTKNIEFCETELKRLSEARVAISKKMKELEDKLRAMAPQVQQLMAMREQAKK